MAARWRTAQKRSANVGRKMAGDSWFLSLARAQALQDTCPNSSCQVPPFCPVLRLQRCQAQSRSAQCKARWQINRADRANGSTRPAAMAGVVKRQARIGETRLSSVAGTAEQSRVSK